jgi:hypothetical protein
MLNMVGPNDSTGYFVRQCLKRDRANEEVRVCDTYQIVFKK